MGELLSEIGDLVFSLVIGYIGALEFIYVVRHLYHWSFRHAAINQNDPDSLQQLQENMLRQLSEAEAREINAGANAMQDGVLYKDGFRLDNSQVPQVIDNPQQSKAQRRHEIEMELVKQQKIKEETTELLKEAEMVLEQQRRENKNFENLEEKRINDDVLESKENERRIIESEKQFQHDEGLREEEEVAEKKENTLSEGELQEFDENERKLLNIENIKVQQQRLLEENEESNSDAPQHRREDVIAENARKFLEAEQKMVELQQQQLSKNKSLKNRTDDDEAPGKNEIAVKERLTSTVKTQFGQTSDDSFSLKSKTILFSEVSDDGSSIEPNSSIQSSISTQPSEEINTGTDDTTQLFQFVRQDPDGEDTTIGTKYSEDYLRSLDGIKQRPLIREDGSGRRRAFKKRRSSGSSNSSRDSRTSREEELKMFTSLEEEELQNLQQSNNDYVPIKYTNEPNLKVKTHHRRHKRSPAKDIKSVDDNRSSLEMLGEENINPWGEVVPEHYKNTEFWKREKAISIDEEIVDVEKPLTSENIQKLSSASNIPKASSFEGATHDQNEAAMSALHEKFSKPIQENKSRPATPNEKPENEITKNVLKDPI